MACELLIFAKEPRPGRVKTRLAERIGTVPAAGIYSILLDWVVRRCQSSAKRWRTVVCLTPDDAVARSDRFLPAGLPVCRQGDGDLGERLERAFAEAWARGARHAVAIGTDCPDLSETDITGAFAALEGVDVALGPAVDGGYYLIGLRASEPNSLRLFRDVDWSTERVYAQTLRRAAAEKLRVGELPTRRDIDTLDDLTVLLERGDEGLCSRLRSVLDGAVLEGEEGETP